MEKIRISIPDNLTPEQEVFKIAQHLGAKMLPKGEMNKIYIGNGYEIKESQTVIEIVRIPTEKVLVTHECFCGIVFTRSVGYKLYSNYGGKTKTLYYCSDNCRQQVIDIAGERVSKIKNKLKPFMKF